SPCADDHEDDIGIITPACRLHQNLYAVGHAYGADIRGYEFASQAEFRTHSFEKIRIQRFAQRGQVKTVLQDADLLLSDALADNVSLEGVGDHDDVVRSAIKIHLDFLEEPNDGASSGRADGHNRIRPQIADLQYEWHALQTCHDVSPDSSEELRRCGNHHVRPSRFSVVEDA